MLKAVVAGGCFLSPSCINAHFIADAACHIPSSSVELDGSVCHGIHRFPGERVGSQKEKAHPVN